MTTLDHEDFGRLRYREDEGWRGWIRLPRFAECRDTALDKSWEAAGDAERGSSSNDRESRRQARRQQELAEGRFPLVLVDPARQGPTRAQRKAFRFLVDHQDQVLNAVLQWMFEKICKQGAWTLEGFVRDDFGVAIDSLDDLKDCLRLESVVIDDGAAGQVAPITLWFSSPLDEEHGIEVTTLQATVENPRIGPWRGEPLGRGVAVAVPFELPSTIDASGISPAPEGHRFVELQYGGRWSGIFVLDANMQCVGTVPHSNLRRLAHPRDIQGVREPTPLRRWRAAPGVQATAMRLVGAVNWLVALPCLVVGWLYEPGYLWACIALGLAAHAVYFLLHRSRERRFGFATGQIILAAGGLAYASRVANFGSQDHVAAMSDLFGLVLWRGTFAIALIGLALLATAVISLRDERFDEWRSVLAFITSKVVGIAALALALMATSSWNWSPLHLLWLTPLALAGSGIAFYIAMTYWFAEKEQAASPCPSCGAPLASPAAQQCLHCGADWHRRSRDGEGRQAHM